MVNFAVYLTDFGHYKIEYDDEVVIAISRTVEGGAQIGRKTALTDRVYRQLTDYFSGRRQTFDFPYQLRGTDFQRAVWRELLKIPYGETRSYKDIAQAIGRPKAYRAVGMANNKNPLSIVVPCHRVIGSNGQLIGYAGGLASKKALLALEAADNKQ